MITLEISFGVFVGLGIFAGIAAVGVAGGLVIRNKLRNVSRQLFGTESIVDGLNKQADIAAETPKSVSGMTRLMEPQIMRDFPDFNWSEFKHKAENMLTSALLAISSEQPEKLVDASEDVKNQVLNIIADNQAAQVREVYNNIKIHQTEISNYRKDKGNCIIVIPSPRTGAPHCGQVVVKALSNSFSSPSCTYNNSTLYFVCTLRSLDPSVT